MVGDDHSIDAHLDRCARVLCPHHALDQEFPFPPRTQPDNVFPGHGRVKLGVNKRLEFIKIVRVGNLLEQVAEAVRLALQSNVNYPVRPAGQLPGFRHFSS